MRLYLLPVMGICFAVDGLLLLASARLTDKAVSSSMILTAALEAAYGGACLLPGWRFLGETWWRIALLAVSSLIAFGVGKGAARSIAVYVLLKMTAWSMAMTSGDRMRNGAMGMAVVFGLCLIALLLRWNQGGMVPIVLRFGGREEQLIALRDTGNTLRDPVTGEQVLVVGAQAAKSLCGLELHHLKDPLGAIQARLLPGMRLIPYKTVGNKGFLLAIRMEDVQIGNRVHSTLVAFAPSGLDGNGTYQALMGGMA